MNFLARTTTSLTLPLVAVGLVAAQAHATNVDPGHMALGRAIAATGIDLKINPDICNYQEADGWYWAAKNELVVCQDNATKAGEEVAWTSNDFDTLRHEAHHLIQDCLDGNLQGDIQNVYVDSPRFVTGVLTQNQIRRIASAYEERGIETIKVELEAFAVAVADDPAEQVRDIQRYCLGN